MSFDYNMEFERLSGTGQRVTVLIMETSKLLPDIHTRDVDISPEQADAIDDLSKSVAKKLMTLSDIEDMFDGLLEAVNYLSHANIYGTLVNAVHYLAEECFEAYIEQLSSEKLTEICLREQFTNDQAFGLVDKQLDLVIFDVMVRRTLGESKTQEAWPILSTLFDLCLERTELSNSDRIRAFEVLIVDWLDQFQVELLEAFVDKFDERFSSSTRSIGEAQQERDDMLDRIVNKLHNSM